MAQNQPNLDPAGAAAGVVNGGAGMIVNALDGLLGGIGHLENAAAGTAAIALKVGDQTFDVWLQGLRDALQNAKAEAQKGVSDVAGGVPKVG